MRKKKKRNNASNNNALVSDSFYLASNKIKKVRLDKIIRSKECLSIIREIVHRVNEVTIDGFNFIKTYYLYCLENNLELLEINQNNVLLILKTVTQPLRKTTYKGNNKIMKDRFDAFYDKVFKDIILKKDKPSLKFIKQILLYCSTSIVTAFSNHINAHYYTFLCRYINLLFNKKEIYNSIKKNSDLTEEEIDEQVKSFNKDMRNIKSAIYYGTDVKLDDKTTLVKNYKSNIKHIRDNILSGINIKHLLYGDKDTKVKSDPLKLLPSLLRMSKDGEKLAFSKLKDKTKKFNIINCFPLRNCLIPKYAKIDTRSLIEIFLKDDKRFSNNISRLKNDIWNRYFKIDKKVFRMTNYTFNGSIMTDGYAASVLFELNDNKSKLTSVSQNNHFYHNLTFDNELSDRDGDFYLNDLSKDKLNNLSKMHLVGIDPGKDDLIFCTDGRLKKDHPEMMLRKCKSDSLIKDEQSVAEQSSGY